MEHKELYETRNYRTAESRIYSNVGKAIIACLAFSSRRTPDAGCWSVSRVSDGAFWRGCGCVVGPNSPASSTFGRRVYTSSGDSIRLERAAKRALDVDVDVAA